jgi:hypothetical protein
MATVEQQIKRLEDENKARKASYPIAGSLVPFVVQKSQIWSLSGGGNIDINIRIKFTPDTPSRTGRYLITLTPEVSIESDMSIRWPKQAFYNEPQSGDGTIILDLIISTPFATFDYYFRATASGTSGGTFVLL